MKTIIANHTIEQDDDEFFNFDKDIVADLVAEGYKGKELTSQLERRKQKLSVAIDKLIDEATKSSSPLTKKQLQTLID